MTSGTMEYSHVQQWQRDILTKFDSIIDTGGGSDSAMALLDDYQNPEVADAMKTKDMDRWSCGMSVSSQVKLLSEMEKKGLIESHSDGIMHQGSTDSTSGSPS